MAVASVQNSFDPSGTGTPIGLGYSSASDQLFTYGNVSGTVDRYSETGSFLGSIANPGGPANDYDIDVVSQPMSLAGVSVPAGSVLLTNGDGNPTIVRAVDPNTGAVLATLTTAVSGGDVAGSTFHAGRGTLFLMKYGEDSISEVDAATGAVINKFFVHTHGYDVFYGDLDVDPISGDLFVVSSQQGTILRLTPTGELVEKIDLPTGVSGLSGIAFDDDKVGVAHVSSTGGLIHRLSGLVGGVTITGTGSNEVISPTKTVAGQPLPTAQGDVLLGLAGNDQLDGGLGGDRMIGGGGSDIYTVENVGDQVIETDATKAGGIDTVKASISYTLGANVEKLTLLGTAGLSGTGNELNNTLTGNSGANILAGLGGKDVLDGKAGADTMTGGLGDDIYVVDNFGDQVVEAAGAGSGIDTVKSSIAYTLGSNVENLSLTGKAGVNGNGNTLNNKLTGNAGNNVLHGLEGNDTIVGGAGNDVLWGDDGADFLTGGAGIDSLLGGTGADRFIFIKTTESGSSMPDTIHDFSQLELDRIDLAKIDANTLTGGNGAFAFIGTEAFSGGGAAGAGQLRYEQAAGVTTIFGDTDGNGTADLVVHLLGTVNLTAGDFML